MLTFLFLAALFVVTRHYITHAAEITLKREARKSTREAELARMRAEAEYHRALKLRAQMRREIVRAHERKAEALRVELLKTETERLQRRTAALLAVPAQRSPQRVPAAA